MINSKFATLICLALFLSLSIVSFGVVVLFFIRDASPEEIIEPILTVVPAEYDFGKVTYGFHEATFELTNVSNKPIKILYTVTSCSCTDVVVSRGKLLPQKNTTLKCRFDANGKKGDVTGTIGVVYQGDCAQTGDSKPKHTIIHLRANVFPPESLPAVQSVSMDRKVGPPANFKSHEDRASRWSALAQLFCPGQ